jgi:signal peptidase I
MTETRRAEGPARGTRHSPIATAVRWATALMLVVAVVGVLALTIGTFTGWLSVQTVPTGSMEPTIHKGSAIAVDPVAVDDVAVGDVIVFAAPTTGTMTVHRVVSIEPGDAGPVFTTKGDANGGPDPWRLSVNGDQVQKVRLAVPVLGQVLLALSARDTRLVLAGLGALFVLGFGLTHVWRRNSGGEAPTTAHATWDAALDRLAHAVPHPHLHHHQRHGPDHHQEPEVASVAEAVTAAQQRRRIDPLLALLADSDATPTGQAGGPHPRVRRATTAGSTLVMLAVVLTLTAAWFPTPTANASLIGTTAASTPVLSDTVPPKTGVSCSWNTATATTLSWTNPVATDSTQVLVATTSGGTTSVGTTAVAGATSVAYAPTAPLTTVRYLSTTAVRSNWTSIASTEMPTNFCTGAIRLTAGSGTNGFAGDGSAATTAAMNTPYQPYEAPDGRIFIADSANNRIRVVSTSGTISTFAGGTGTVSACTYTGAVASLRLSGPRGVAVDSAGNVYIADTGAACIRKVDAAGNVTRFAGGGATTTCNTAVAPTSLSLSSPSGLAIDGTGAVIVADTGRNCIRRLTATTTAIIAGGGATTTCGATTSTAVSLSAPIGVAVDSSNNVYIADTGRNCVRKVVGTTVTAVAGGGATTTCGTTTSTAVSLSAPQGVDVASDGSVYIADTGRRCVRKVVGTAVTLLAFTGTNSSSGDDGPAQAATSSIPAMLGVMADGDLLVTDRATTAGSSDARRIELS